MTTKELKAKNPSPVIQPQETLSRAEAVPLEAEPAEQNWETHGHRGDWLVFVLWIICFLLMAALNVFDMVRVLIAWAYG